MTIDLKNGPGIEPIGDTSADRVVALKANPKYFTYDKNNALTPREGTIGVSPKTTLTVEDGLKQTTSNLVENIKISLDVGEGLSADGTLHVDDTVLTTKGSFLVEGLIKTKVPFESIGAVTKAEHMINRSYADSHYLRALDDIPQDVVISTNSASKLSIVAASTKEALATLYGAAGRVFVGKTVDLGGGIAFAGSSHAAGSGMERNFLNLYNTGSGSLQWTARNSLSNYDWEFRGKVIAPTIKATKDPIDPQDVTRLGFTDKTYVRATAEVETANYSGLKGGGLLNSSPRLSLDIPNTTKVAAAIATDKLLIETASGLRHIDVGSLINTNTMYDLRGTIALVANAGDAQIKSDPDFGTFGVNPTGFNVSNPGLVSGAAYLVQDATSNSTITGERHDYYAGDVIVFVEGALLPWTTAIAGVASFNGRVGAVIPLAADYSNVYGSLVGDNTFSGKVSFEQGVVLASAGDAWLDAGAFETTSYVEGISKLTQLPVGSVSFSDAGVAIGFDSKDATRGLLVHTDGITSKGIPQGTSADSLVRADTLAASVLGNMKADRDALITANHTTVDMRIGPTLLDSALSSKTTANELTLEVSRPLLSFTHTGASTPVSLTFDKVNDSVGIKHPESLSVQGQEVQSLVRMDTLDAKVPLATSDDMVAGTPGKIVTADLIRDITDGAVMYSEKATATDIALGSAGKWVDSKGLYDSFAGNSAPIVSNGTANHGDAAIGTGYPAVQHYGRNAIGKVLLGSNSIGGMELGSLHAQADQARYKLYADNGYVTFNEIIDTVKNGGGGGGGTGDGNLASDGSIPMDAGYTPKVYQDIATKTYVDSQVTGIDPLRPIEGLLIYYGYPIAFKELWDADAVIRAIAGQWDVYVVGDGYQYLDHEEFASTKYIIEELTKLGVRCYGYVAAVFGGVGGPTRPIERRAQDINAWLDNLPTLYGIFFDEFGYDYMLTRANQNLSVDYQKGRIPVDGRYVSRVVPTMYNMWFFTAFMEDTINTSVNLDGEMMNPNGVPINFRDKRDSIMYELFAMGGEGLQNQYGGNERYESFERLDAIGHIDTLTGETFRYRREGIAMYGTKEIVPGSDKWEIDLAQMAKQGITTTQGAEEYVYMMAEMWQMDSVGIADYYFGTQQFWADSLKRRAPDQFARSKRVKIEVSNWFVDAVATYENGETITSKTDLDTLTYDIEWTNSTKSGGDDNDGSIIIGEGTPLLADGSVGMKYGYAPTTDYGIATKKYVDESIGVVTKGTAVPLQTAGSEGDKYFRMSTDVGYPARLSLTLRLELEGGNIANDWVFDLSSGLGSVQSGNASTIEYIRVAPDDSISLKMKEGKSLPLTMCSFGGIIQTNPSPSSAGVYYWPNSYGWRKNLDTVLGYFSEVILNADPNLTEYSEYRKTGGVWIPIDLSGGGGGGETGASVTHLGEGLPSTSIGKDGDKYIRKAVISNSPTLQMVHAMLRAVGDGWEIASIVSSSGWVANYLGLSYNSFQFYYPKGTARPGGTTATFAGFSFPMSTGVWVPSTTQECTLTFNTSSHLNISQAYSAITGNPLNAAGYSFSLSSERNMDPYREYAKEQGLWSLLNIGRA